MMQVSNIPIVESNVSVGDVNAFCNCCVSMRSTYRHFQILFEGSELQRELLQRTAPTFFNDIHLVMMQDLVLQICKVTDPENTSGRRNLTIKFLLNNSDFASAPGELDKLKRLSESMHIFRTKIVPARNKIIGHLDRQSVHDGNPLGATEKHEWDQFWLDLQDFLQIMHKQYVDPRGHFYLSGIAYLSDADDLLKALKESTYFRALLADNQLTQECADVAFNSKFSAV